MSGPTRVRLSPGLPYTILNSSNFSVTTKYDSATTVNEQICNRYDN